MKIYTCTAFILWFNVVFAQKQSVNYYSIDWDVVNIDAPSPAEVAQKLATKYKTDLERTRAIFSWIAQHISYNNKFNRPGRKNKTSLVDADHTTDSSTSLPQLNPLVAEDVMKKRTAFCYGYARLFKFLCDHAGIRCELVTGYARGDLNGIGNSFRTNHTWNAVQIDSNWYLLDVTWASGYFTYGTSEYVKRFDDKYFLTPPEQFAQDHFPDDLEWSLLQQPPAIREFQHSPYKGRCFAKYNVISFFPSTGIIKAAIDDTINLQVSTDLVADRRIGGGSLEDSSILGRLPEAVFCKPVANKDNVINYKYIVRSSDAQWLQLVYNDDMILRYKLDITDNRGGK